MPIYLLVIEFFELWNKACKQSSANLFVAPITFVALTALSLDINTRFETFWFIDACATANAENTLFLTPSAIFSSTKGTCL